MEKARRTAEQNLKLVDVVIELLDARAPLSSHNPVLDKIASKKPRLVVFNKADLADEKLTSYWLKKFSQDSPALAVDSKSRKGLPYIPGVVEKMARVRTGRPVKCMVLGIPNVGKSLFINALAKRKVARTGNKPGVTRGQQWIKVGKKVQLLDTPGILWPKFEDPEVGFRLAVIAAIKEEIYSVEDIVFGLIEWLNKYSPCVWEKRYGLYSSDTPVEIMEQVGRKRGFFLAGGKVDLNRAAVHILKEFREGKLGFFTLDDS